MTGPAETGTVHHATALVVGEAGILIRGPAGAGKSTVARELIAAAERGGRFARLVCDDRVRITASGDRLIARALPAIAGLLEVRGIGLVRVPYEEAAVLRLVVDLDEAPARLPDGNGDVSILAVSLPRFVVNRALARDIVLWRLASAVTKS